MDAPRPPIEIVDGVPVGWSLDRNSWSAHRMFYREVGRPMAFREYSRLLRQRDDGAECLHKKLGVWRVLGDHGELIVVQRAGHTIRQILPADWTPPPAPAPESAPDPAPPPAPTPVNPAASAPSKLTPGEARARLGLPTRG